MRKKNCLVIGNQQSELEKLYLFLKENLAKSFEVKKQALSLHADEMDDLRLSLESDNDDTFIIHLNKDYNELLSAHLLENDQKKLSTEEEIILVENAYKNDLGLHRLKSLIPCYFTLYTDEITQKVEALFEFLEEELSKEQTEKTETLFPQNQSRSQHSKREVQQAIETAEKNRSFFNNTLYLSNVAKASYFKDKNENQQIVTFGQPVRENDFPTVLFVDIFPSQSFIKDFFLNSLIPQPKPLLFIVFTSFGIIQPLLEERENSQFLMNGQLKLWHVSEWKEKLAEEYHNPKKPFRYCRTLRLDTNHPLKDEVINEIRKYVKPAQAVTKR